MSGFAKKIRYSGPLKERLEDECKRAKVKYHIPERNVVTRWNSTVVMMESAFTLRTPVDNLCDREPGLSKYKLTELEWQLVSQLRPILAGFLDATRIMSQSNICLVTDVIPLIDTLHAGLTDVVADTSNHPAVRHAVQRGISALNKYYSLTDDSYIARFALRSYAFRSILFF
ncbi:hypothetical protein BOTBODRAFT_122328 [Botryobasidium botryosum FD-172 SS1]|uniref:Uncharacterized protein n=1 Tax=Botryobasidium botryosum (strain FD-172 SS1) TaxID=930990 RepID=A0A067M1H9_BOTB1|nr:hypothetical protein BOTBODRAFT_122328 [Botryobasidium botryosum FD-172 SS1]